MHHADGLGSTRALSNLDGQRTDAYSYDVFGAVRAHAGTADQSFTFTGEQVDDELGLVYLRARYYDPQVGRFSTSDRFSGFIVDDQSINSYVHAQNSPVNYSDRNGEFIVTALAVVALGFSAYEAYTAWQDFGDNVDALESNLSGYYDIEDPEWEDKYSDYNPAQDIFVTARSGAYTAMKTPGTTVGGDLPKSLDWTVQVRFAADKLLLPRIEKPTTNRIEQIYAPRTPEYVMRWDQGDYYSSGGGWGGGGGGSWGGDADDVLGTWSGPPSSSK